MAAADPPVTTPAREAWQIGQRALTAGDIAGAAPWLDRAGRLAPDDEAITLSRAVLRLRQGNPSDAIDLLEPLLARHDLREGLLALAAAWLELERPEQAAAALGRLLGGHVMPADSIFAILAGQIAEQVQAAGWCGLRADGRLELRRHGNARGRLSVLVDGAPARPRAVLASGAVVEVAVGGVPLLGSPLALARMRRTEGVVQAGEGGLEGWAWHPADPDTDAVLRVCGADGNGCFTVVADDADMQAANALARPRRFRVPPARLAGLRLPVQVRGRDGVALAGSPLDPFAEARSRAAIAAAIAGQYPFEGPPSPAATGLALAPLLDAPRGLPAAARAAPRRRVAVVVPVYAGRAVTLACLDQVFATVPAGTVVVVVDDATPEPALAADLDRLAASKRIRLLRHATNQGFPASANAGLRLVAGLAGGPDAVLLNSDTSPAPGWLEALRQAVHAAPDIGSACPLSNDATILSYPRADAPNPPPAGRALARLARLAAQANGAEVVDIPTGVGFCMYIRRECLAATGVFRADVFAQGYGEENDFCRRAHHLGWRHVAVTGAYVAHVSGASFGAAKAPLLVRNLALLEALHPGYRAAIARFQEADPLAPARRRIDVLRWRAARRRRPAAAILITHNQGGGTERVVATRAAALRARGLRPIVLRPAVAPDEIPDGSVAIAEPEGEAYPALRYHLPAEAEALAALLRGDRAEVIEVHHMLGHDHALLALAARLGVPTQFHVHDYASFCPRISLLGIDRRYCGEPEQVGTCEACIADAGSHLHETIGVAALRARSAADFAAAVRVCVPSADAAARLRRHFPRLAPEVASPEDDRDLPPLSPAPQGARRRVVVVGAIGPEKGYDVLLACARDAAARDLPLEFIVAGHTVDDARLLATARVFVTGRYAEDEAMALIRAQNAQIAFIPSIWPETWCFALGSAWRAGLGVACFDIGAQAERLRATRRGWLLPLGLPTVAINNALLSVSPRLADV